MPAPTSTPRAERGGIDLGGTKIEAIVVDPRNNVVGAARRPTPTEGGPEDVAAAMIAAMTEAARAAGIETTELKGIGVGSPGLVDAQTGAVTRARTLPGWDGSFELGSKLAAELGAQVF